MHHQPQSNAVYAYCKTCKKRKTRTVQASGARRTQGRPIGLLVAWLGMRCPGDPVAVFASRPSLEARQVARAALNDDPEAFVFFELERPARDGEESEPLSD